MKDQSLDSSSFSLGVVWQWPFPSFSFLTFVFWGLRSNLGFRKAKERNENRPPAPVLF